MLRLQRLNLVVSAPVRALVENTGAATGHPAPPAGKPRAAVTVKKFISVRSQAHGLANDGR